MVQKPEQLHFPNSPAESEAPVAPPVSSEGLQALGAAGLSVTETKDLIASGQRLVMTNPLDQMAADEMVARRLAEDKAGVERKVGLAEQKEHFERTSGQVIDPENRD